METPGEYTYFTPDEVQAKLSGDEPPIVVDVRDDWEFERYHIPDAIHIPLDEIAARADEVDSDREIVVVCEHGMRSEVAADFLISAGYERVGTMDGGMAVYEGTVISGK
jgi:rhodanese-related sulfurtransferase